MSIQWTPSLVQKVGPEMLRKLLKRFNNDVFTSDECKIFRDMLVHATDRTTPVYAAAWHIWQALIIRFRLFEIADLKDWITLAARLDSKGIRTPRFLARIPFGELPRVEWECSPPDAILLTWLAVRQDCGGFPVMGVGLEPPSLRDFQNLTDSIRTESIEDAAALRDYRDERRSPGLPPNYERLSAAKKMDCLRETGADPLAITGFLTLGAKRSTLRAFAGSLRPAASGMQSFLNFCTLTGRKPCPVQADTALLWSNMFQPGSTFQMYMAHLAKAAILSKQPTDWMCPDIKSVMRGLANAQDLSFKFENFLFADDLLRLIRATKLTSEFGCAAFLSCLFLLRAASETLQIRKAAQHGRISDFAPQGVKILMGSALLADMTC